MTHRESFLAALERDGEARARFVETLRASATELRAPSAPIDGATRAALAASLLDAARQLCAHTRHSPDGSCRYCDWSGPDA
jgi:hypothetical protein